MNKPLRSEASPAPQSLQFTHFGVLNAGAQSKSSLITSVTVNVILAALLIAVGAATKKVVDERHRVAMLVDPIVLKEPEPPPRPVMIPPRLPKPPVIKTPPPPVQVVPEVRLPDPPKVAVVKPAEPVPVNKPAPPRLVTPPAAPQPVSLAHPEAARVVNTSPRPTAVALGRPDSPIAPSNRAATAAVDLGQRGAPGMPSSNTGQGPRSTTVNLGSGSPGSNALSGNGSRAVQGVALGRPGGTGPMNSTGRNAATAGQVNLGVVQTPNMPKPAAVTAGPARTGPKVLFKPRPEYTAEARSLHLEGTVSVRLHLSASGAVTVLGVNNGLGHGLDEAARRAVQATRFQPAVDASGHPVDWDGVVNVLFQLAD